MKKTIFIMSLILSLLNASSFMGGNTPVNSDPISSIMNSESSEIQNKKKNYKELISFLEKSTNGEYVMYLATLYLNGSVTPDELGNTVDKDLDKAEKFFKRSISLGYFESAAILGSLYLFDDGFIVKENNIEKAEHFLSLAIKNEIYEATVALSSIYFFYKKDVDKGLEVLMIGADKGVSSAQLGIATLFAYGSKDLDIKQNKMLANKYLEKACLNKVQTKKVKEFCHSKNVIREDK